MTDDLTALREQLSRVPESELYVRVDKRDLQSLLDRLERAEAAIDRAWGLLAPHEDTACGCSHCRIAAALDTGKEN